MVDLAEPIGASIAATDVVDARTLLQTPDTTYSRYVRLRVPLKEKKETQDLWLSVCLYCQRTVPVAAVVPGRAAAVG